MDPDALSDASDENLTHLDELMLEALSTGHEISVAGYYLWGSVLLEIERRGMTKPEEGGLEQLLMARIRSCYPMLSLH